MENAAHFGALNYCVLGTYMVAMFAIGLSFSGKQKTTDDYFLAGRNMPWLIVSMSIFASVTSAISYMGIPGLAYSENISLVVGEHMGLGSHDKGLHFNLLFWLGLFYKRRFP